MKSALRFLLITGLLLASTVRSQPEGQAGGNTELRMLTDSIAGVQRQLDSMRGEIERLDGELAALSRRERDCLEQLEVSEQRLRLTVAHLRTLTASIQYHSREIARTAASADSTSRELANRKRSLAARMVGIYKYSRLLSINAFTSARSLSEFYSRIAGLRWVARADRQLLIDIEKLGRELNEQQNRLLAARASLEQLSQEAREREQELLQARAAQAALLEQIRSTRSTNVATSERLRRSSEEMQQLLSELQRRYSGISRGSGFANLRGNLPWPVHGRIIARFGSRTHPRYKTRTTNLGIDIQPAAPSTVSSVAAGRVVFSDRFLGYGNLVIVDHGDGYYSLYGNLDELSTTVGTSVLTGSSIGTVSDYLHFEVRNQGQPFDPEQWLRRNE